MSKQRPNKKKKENSILITFVSFMIFIVSHCVPCFSLDLFQIDKDKGEKWDISNSTGNIKGVTLINQSRGRGGKSGRSKLKQEGS